MPIKKQQLKTKPVCKATFKISKEAAQGAQTAQLAGEFNDWDIQATPMKRNKDGSFTVTVNLESGKEYQFRYLLDGERWENDWEADKYVPAGGHDNSVVVT